MTYNMPNTFDFEELTDAVINALKENLNNEITTINAEKGDSLQVPFIDDEDYYYEEPAYRRSGATRPVLIYNADGEPEVEEPLTALSAVTYTIPIQINLYSNDRTRGETAHRLLSRYQAALIRVLNKNFELADPYAKIRIVEVGRPFTKLVNDEGIALRSVEVVISATAGI